MGGPGPGDPEAAGGSRVQAGLSPESEEGKEITALHRRWLTLTGNRYDPTKHRGIAELYVMDERFTAYYDKQVSGCARFLRDAVVHWAK
ncbi:TipAS antibiotic-recognition domain-containing protein [Dysosmobacter sp. Phy]